MGFSNLVAFFIILTAAVTLHAHGMTDIQTSAQAAEALRPMAGKLAFALFAAGIIGTGLLAVPVLAGVRRLCRGRGVRLAQRAGAQTAGGRVFLRRARSSPACRHGAEPHSARPDQGAVLERGDQRRGGRAADGR